MASRCLKPFALGLPVELLKFTQGLMVLGRSSLVPHRSSKEMWLSLFFHGICSKFHLILCRCSTADLLEAALHPKLNNWTSSNIVRRHRHINFLLQIIDILSNVHLNSLGQCEARIRFQWESSDQPDGQLTVQSTWWHLPLTEGPPFQWWWFVLSPHSWNPVRHTQKKNTFNYRNLGEYSWKMLAPISMS